jgi:hypothetical protein
MVPLSTKLIRQVCILLSLDMDEPYAKINKEVLEIFKKRGKLDRTRPGGRDTAASTHEEMDFYGCIYSSSVNTGLSRAIPKQILIKRLPLAISSMDITGPVVR